jgi:hypothetical protein
MLNLDDVLFLFEQGRYDGFSPDEVERMLEITGELCPDVADYELTHVLRLISDFYRGHFASAFQPKWRATVHEADPHPARTRCLPHPTLPDPEHSRCRRLT